MKGFAIFVLVVVILGLIGSCSSDNSGSTNGRYGRGEQYDRAVYEAADAFGESPDRVNDVYEALGNEMY